MSGVSIGHVYRLLQSFMASTSVLGILPISVSLSISFHTFSSFQRHQNLSRSCSVFLFSYRVSNIFVFLLILFPVYVHVHKSSSPLFRLSTAKKTFFTLVQWLLLFTVSLLLFPFLSFPSNNHLPSF